jgi:hypothetical protein
MPSKHEKDQEKTNIGKPDRKRKLVHREVKATLFEMDAYRTRVDFTSYEMT